MKISFFVFHSFFDFLDPDQVPVEFGSKNLDKLAINNYQEDLNQLRRKSSSPSFTPFEDFTPFTPFASFEEKCYEDILNKLRRSSSSPSFTPDNAFFNGEQTNGEHLVENDPIGIHKSKNTLRLDPLIRYSTIEGYQN